MLPPGLKKTLIQKSFDFLRKSCDFVMGFAAENHDFPHNKIIRKSHWYVESSSLETGDQQNTDIFRRFATKT